MNTTLLRRVQQHIPAEMVLGIVLGIAGIAFLLGAHG